MELGEPCAPPPPIGTQAVVFSHCERHNHAMLSCNWNRLRLMNKLKSTTRIWTALCRGFLARLQTATPRGQQKVAVFTQLGFGAC